MRLGVPYAEAGVQNGRATSTCPECGQVFISGREGESGTKGPQSSARKYAVHYVETHENAEN